MKRFILVILTIFLVSACSTSSIRIGWTCTDGINELDCNYREFTGREIEEIDLEPAEMVEIKYDVEVESGILAIQLEDPEGEIVWKTEQVDDFSGEITLPADEKGRYRMIVEGQETQGSFLIEWDIRD
jgi:hypothetical protein